MIPVEQRHLHVPGGPLGDCLTACVASILELPYELVPHFVAEDDWWGCYTRFLAGFGLYAVHFGCDGDERPEWWLPGGYWVATVKSPRVVNEDGSPGLQHDDELAWDPHPRREEGHLGFVGADVYVPLDPALTALAVRVRAMAAERT